MIEREPTYKFGSIFADPIEKYLQLRKALGSKITPLGSNLRLFDRYCIEQNITVPAITSELVNNWLTSFPDNKGSSRSQKISVLKGFSAYYAGGGNIVTWVPKPGYTNTPKYIPYIFTEDEIQRIMKAADSLRKNFGNTRFHIIFPVILRVLYGCGLRVSEALRLRVKDVDLENGFLYIFDGKFEKSRRIPISESLRTVLSRYYDGNLDYIGTAENAFFFPNPSGEQYSQRTVYDKFREVLWNCGIPHQGKGKGPRVHDLRHTFAVRSLHQSLLSGKNNYTALTALMVYLGHSKVSSTEYYLRLTADVYSEIHEKTSAITERIIPKEVLIDE